MTDQNPCADHDDSSEAAPVSAIANDQPKASSDEEKWI